MTHRRVRLEQLTDGSSLWWAAIHVCPSQTFGVGIGKTVAEALHNAAVGFGNSLSLHA